MNTATRETIPFSGHLDAPSSPLPAALRLLCVSSRQPLWAGLTLRLDAAGCVEPHFRWVSTAHEVLEILRSESPDCILIHPDPAPAPAPISVVLSTSTEKSALNAETLLPAIRAAGCDDPTILLADSLSDSTWTIAYAHDCDVLISPGGWDSPVLLPAIARAITRADLVRDHHRLTLAAHRRLVRERDEAERLLVQQREMIRDLEGLAALPDDSAREERADRPVNSSVPVKFSVGVKSSVGEQTASGTVSDRLPAELGDHYHELLRTYVIMGSGSLGADITRMAEAVSMAQLSPREVLRFHVTQVEVLVRGLGSRSTGHVIARADLLALELMIRLGECYQQRLAQ